MEVDKFALIDYSSSLSVIFFLRTCSRNLSPEMENFNLRSSHEFFLKRLLNNRLNKTFINCDHHVEPWKIAKL